jgi:hypothetical protein
MATKILIVLRAGAGSLHRSWSRVCAGHVDVAISLYDDLPVDDSEYVVTHRCRGSKFGGLQAFFAAHPWIIDAYTHFWLFEDDLYLPLDSLLTAQEAVERYGLTLSAPSLAPESFATWEITIRNDAFYLRATDFIEIMAPIMSRDFLRAALPLFAECHSAWGSEWLWRRILNEMNTFGAILDAAPIVHTRPVGQGTLYQAATGARISPADEMNALFRRHGIDPAHAPFRNLFGLDRTGRRLLYGPAFRTEAQHGYQSLLSRYPDVHRRCHHFLMDAPAAVKTLQEVLSLNGAAALLPA